MNNLASSESLPVSTPSIRTQIPSYKVPLRLFSASGMTVISEDTMKLSPGLLSSLIIPSKLTEPIQGSIDIFLTAFREIELAHAEIVRQPENTFIRLTPIKNELSASFSELELSLEQTVSRDNAKIITHLLKSQLRSSGTDALELSFIDHGVANNYRLSWSTIDLNGKVIQVFEGKDIEYPSFMNLARWSHLEKLVSNTSKE